MANSLQDQPPKPEKQEAGEKRGSNVKIELVPPLDKKIERIAEQFKPVFELRESQYDRDLEADPSKKGLRSNLDTHNKIVFGYAVELVDAINLSPEERTAAIIATIEHDAGKIASQLLEHHEQGVEYADIAIDKLTGQVFEGVTITPEIKKKALEAVERHMNHPFLVMLNKGKRFPEPQDNVDRVVFDADMLANAGFKNMAFRLTDEDFLSQDVEAAKENETLPLQETVANVLQGIISLPDTVLTEQARTIAQELVESVQKIQVHLIKNEGILAQIQSEFSDKKGNFSIETIAQNGGFQGLKTRLNEKILKAANKLGIDMSRARTFQM
jgi:hypothetical protein